MNFDTDEENTMSPLEINNANANNYCKQCGRPLVDNQKFCSGCGSKLSSTKEARNWDSDTSDEDSKGNNDLLYTVLGAVGGLFIPIIGVILFFVFREKKPKCARIALIAGLIGFLCNIFLTITSYGNYY